MKNSQNLRFLSLLGMTDTLVTTRMAVEAGARMSGSNNGSGTAAESAQDTSQTTPAVAMAAPSTGTATVTVTETAASTASTAIADQVLRLTLASRPSVRWDENVEDNEGLGRKSSKRCCIFHKQRAFGESSTDSSAEENDSDVSDGSDGGNEDGDKKPKANRKNRKIARPKKKIPDYQRFHA
jgi:protein phosphatase 1 regulatory subunit 11